MVRLTNNEKILFGSVLASLVKRKILGDEVNVKPLSLLNALIKSEKFAIAQYDNGNQDYYEKVIKIKKLITNLKNKCGEICAYRERHVSPEISTFCGTVPTPEPNEVVSE